VASHIQLLKQRCRRSRHNTESHDKGYQNIPIWITARFDEEKPWDDKDFATGFFPTLFLAVAVAVAVAILLDFEGEEDNEALFLLFGGAIASTSNKESAEQQQAITKETREAQWHKQQEAKQRDMGRGCWETTKVGWEARQNCGGLKNPGRSGGKHDKTTVDWKNWFRVAKSLFQRDENLLISCVSTRSLGVIRICFMFFEGTGFHVPTGCTQKKQRSSIWVCVTM
jgi:hypothetical protein